MVIKKSIIFGIAILVVVAFLVGWTLFPSAGGAIRNWNSVDPDISGQWKTELWITFADGSTILADDISTDTLSLLFTDISGVPVSKLQYKVSAQATTDGIYDTVYLNSLGLFIKENIMLEGTANQIFETTPNWVTGDYAQYYDITDIVSSIPVDGQWHEILSCTSDLSNPLIQDAVESNPHDSGASYKGYAFGYWIEGGIQFRGSPDEDWKSTDSPASAHITLEIISNELFVELSGDVTVIYT